MAILAAKYYYSSSRFEYNHIVYEQTFSQKKKIIEYKESVVIIPESSTTWWAFDQKSEYDILLICSPGIDWHLFFKEYWSLISGNKIPNVIDFFDEGNFNDSYFFTEKIIY